MKNQMFFYHLKAIILLVILGLNISQIQGESKKNQPTKNRTDSFVPEDLRLTVCYDNNSCQPELTTAWGFACVIQGAEKTILFDTGGDGSVLLENLAKADIDPVDIDIVILSHIHADHTGGLTPLLKKNPAVVVYLPQSFPKDFQQKVAGYGATIVPVQESVRLCRGVYSTGEMGRWIKEQSLIIRTSQGLIILTGCAHPGIVRIVRQAQKLFRDEVLLVAGGFHLSRTAQPELVRIVNSFKKLGVRYAGPCHCSGESARQLFQQEYRDNYLAIGVGKVIDLDDFE